MRPLKLVPDSTNIPFLKFRNIAMFFSIALILGSIVLCIVRGFNLGIDFVGGQTVRVHFDRAVPIDQIREKLGSLGFEDVTIQEYGSANEIGIRSPLSDSSDTAAEVAATKMRGAILGSFPGARVGGVESVSGKVSQELFRTGMIALVLAMLGITIYIWFRFEWQFAVGALFALAHDVALTLGFFALTQLEFDLNIVAAVLTIIGYSLNDTIVVYDRIRENMRKYRKMGIRELLDLSVNETLSRTMVTSLSIGIVLLVLLLLGPDVIFGFTAAMLLGIVIGTFSSVYVSAAILLWLRLSPDSFVQKPAAKGHGGNAERVGPREDLP